MKSFPPWNAPASHPRGGIAHAARPSPPLSAPARFSRLQSDPQLLNAVRSLEPRPLRAVCSLSGFPLPLPKLGWVSGHRLEGRRGLFPARFLSPKPPPSGRIGWFQQSLGDKRPSAGTSARGPGRGFRGTHRRQKPRAAFPRARSRRLRTRPAGRRRGELPGPARRGAGRPRDGRATRRGRPRGPTAQSRPRELRHL